ncbi:MAG: hypothetical protein GAK32_02272 [Pseudomonas fluorescens]|nr:MAG: hypothetical protein GAK32_02272 [Pseudomonas fluorescens]
MNTPDHRADAPATQAVLNHLLEIDPALRPHFPLAPALPAQLQTLQKINTTLKQANAQWLSQAQALYQDQVPANLNQRLQALDDASPLDNQGRKTYMTFTAGSTAAELEARLNAADSLLAPSDVSMVEDCSRGPDFRPGMYALTFTYQQQTVVFAGAFVLTRQASPQVKGLTGGEKVGDVLLFTPSRGLEAFTSLSELDQNLLDAMRSPDGREEFIRHIPARFQALNIAGIWPLELLSIEGEPLFEHTWNAVLDKRRQDVEHALSLDDKQQTSALDKALAAALPDLTLRLELRTQRLLEWNLYKSLSDGYRSATPDQQQTLAKHLAQYNVSRRMFLDLLGPAATPHALAQTQLTEWLDEELDIHDLDPNQLHLITQRTVPDVGTYEQQRSLVELSLRGLHTHDEQAGSDFLQHTRLTYAGKVLSETHVALTPASLLPLLQTLGPRLDFAAVQQAMRAEPTIRQAARDMLDQRLVALACMARLQGHLSHADHQLFEQLRADSTPHLRAQSLSLHGAQLKDLWVLREDDGRGQVKRLLLCTPESPRSQAFIAFASERECQVHILGWAANDMHDYLVKQVPLRFVSSMKSILESISFKPDALEHLDVTFGPPCSHTDCLNAMVSHLLDGQLLDDYEHGTPPWYRAASPADRTRLTSLSEDAIGALHSYNTWPDAEARFPPFDAYLHEQARLSLNTLLGRRQNDVDPDSVFAYAPNNLLGRSSPPLSYTRLYRDGYADGIGFINEKFSSSATFRGPPGVDLSPLTPQNVARSVTGVWIGQRYIEQVRKRLQAADSPGYVRRRDATLKITQLQMNSAALESRLKGHIASVDLAWLERAIDSLPDTSIATRNLYQVHRLSIDDDWVMGCYLFRHGDDPVLLYTPNAPDEVGFRPARLFNYLVKKDNGLLAYLTARVAVQSRTRINQFLLTAQKGLPDDINRSTPSPARYDAIQHAKPLTDLRHDLYNMRLQRRIDDVQATTVNRTQVITGILWTCVEWVTAIATIPFPALSLSLGGLLAFKDAMLALNAYYQGDKNAAFQHYLGYLANLGGALLFDLRPALAGPFNTLSPVRPLLKSAQQGEPLKHLQPHTPDTLKPVLFDGQPMWTTPTPDALGRHLLYRQDPVTGHLQSTARWVNQNAEGRWVRSGIAGGGRKKYQTLVDDTDDTLAVYEVPADQARPYRAVLDPSFKNNLSQDWDVVAAQTPLDSTHEALRPLRAAYARQVDRLVQDADVFFQAPPALPTRAALPTLAVDTQIPDVLKTLLGQNRRLVAGAANASIASKQILIENMQALADMGVKRLYIENLPADLFRNKLRIINREATGNLPVALKRIEEHLARVDLALGYGHEAPFTFRRLMLQAHQHNIAVDGLDAAASYHMEHLLDLADGERLIPRSSRLRNFYSHQALQRNAAKNPDEGWIVLAEQDRIGNYERTPGLADLQNAWALRIEDVAAGQPVGLWTDRLAASQSRGHVRRRCPRPSMHAPNRARLPCRQPSGL